jgi:hypothetical protein
VRGRSGISCVRRYLSGKLNKEITPCDIPCRCSCVSRVAISAHLMQRHLACSSHAYRMCQPCLITCTHNWFTHHVARLAYIIRNTMHIPSHQRRSARHLTSHTHEMRNAMHRPFRCGMLYYNYQAYYLT